MSTRGNDCCDREAGFHSAACEIAQHDNTLKSLREILVTAKNKALAVSAYKLNGWAKALVEAVERAEAEARYYSAAEDKRRADEGTL